MHNHDRNTKTANIGVVLIDPDDWTASACSKCDTIGKSIKLACGIDVTERIFERMFERVFGDKNLYSKLLGKYLKNLSFKMFL
jgi:hypothetical protein